MASHQRPPPPQAPPSQQSDAPSETTTTTAPTSSQTHTITCHCKSISLTFPWPLREPALECLCSICRRYGALWAYYKVDEVQIDTTEKGVIEPYIYGRKRLAFNRCKKCGCMTHYSVVKPEETEDRVAVNCRMFDRKEYDALEREESDGD